MITDVTIISAWTPSCATPGGITARMRLPCRRSYIIARATAVARSPPFCLLFLSRSLLPVNARERRLLPPSVVYISPRDARKRVVAGIGGWIYRTASAQRNAYALFSAVQPHCRRHNTVTLPLVTARQTPGITSFNCRTVASPRTTRRV